MGLESHVLRGPITDIYTQLKGKIKVLIKPDSETVYQKGLAISKVKTIWQTDKAVDLNKFYYPSKILLGDKKVQINSLNDVPQNESMVIQGTAGQGKSIFLRYLSGAELKEGRRVPIFIELMKVSDKYSLNVLIANALTEYGLNCRVEEVEKFLATERFSLLLDAFDELPSEHVKDSLSYIEHLVSRFPFLQVLITSRPNSDIQNSAYFSVYDLAPLEPSDFKPILEKFYINDHPEVHKVLSYLKGESAEISHLIKTPLLLTLLCITYNATNKIPSSPYEFYQKLFHLLAERHDSTKPGFRRKFFSKLTINQLEKLFEAFSFYCMKSEVKTLTLIEATKKVREASDLSEVVPTSESAFLDDCVKNTCLLLKEGYEYQFIHKSVREYHSASYIKSANSDLKNKFYTAAVKKHARYVEELKYLSYIDTDSYERYFLVPVYEGTLEALSYDGENCNARIVIPQSCTVWFVVNQNDGNKVSMTRARHTAVGMPDLPHFELSLGFCFFKALEVFIKNIMVIDDDEAKSVTFPSLNVQYLNRSEKFDSINTQEYKISFNDGDESMDNDAHQAELEKLTKEFLLKRCINIEEKLSSLKQKIDIKDKNISELEF
jgi:hypothetical protein